MSRASSEQGVYYAEQDYIGVGRRLMIDLVDFLVASLLAIAVTWIAYALLPNGDAEAVVGLVVWTVTWLGYFVVLKRSRFRTIGYVLARASIVDLRGERPSLMTLFIRLLFVLFGPPLNLLFDLFWIPSDPCRQALRDKFTHTYVVRSGAMPAGTGPIAYSHYTILGGCFLFPEVRSAHRPAAV